MVPSGTTQLILQMLQNAMVDFGGSWRIEKAVVRGISACSISENEAELTDICICISWYYQQCKHSANVQKCDSRFWQSVEMGVSGADRGEGGITTVVSVGQGDGCRWALDGMIRSSDGTAQ